MARKESITKQMISDVAFQMVREEGLQGITARHVAERANCSTQPIFRSFPGMEELTQEVYDMAIAFFRNYYRTYPQTESVPFCNMGMACISFAKEEKELFRLLFAPKEQKKSLYEILNGSTENVKSEIQKAIAIGCTDPSGLFMKMWIFIYGVACMTMTGDYDLSDQETRKLLSDTCKAPTVSRSSRS